MSFDPICAALHKSFPVVELTTTLTNGVSLTEAESEALEKAFNKNTPIVTKCNFSTDFLGGINDCSVVWSKGGLCGDYKGAPAYFASFGSVMLMLVNIGTGWNFMAQ